MISFRKHALRNTRCSVSFLSGRGRRANPSRGLAALAALLLAAASAFASPQQKGAEKPRSGEHVADAQKEYQPAYAAYFIGRFVSEFARAYADRDSKKRVEPWIIYSARLNDALVDMAKAFPDLAVTSIQALCADILVGFEQKRNPSANALTNHLNNTPPAVRSIYKSDDKAVVTLKGARP